MNLSSLIQKSVLFIELSIIMSVTSYSYRDDLFQPIELVDFNLMGGQDNYKNYDRSRYRLLEEGGTRRRKLPVLNRGVRDLTEKLDDLSAEDPLSEPSCSELRRMWRIARRIHTHSLETNEIPQELHPFSPFEADRFRAERRFGRVNLGQRRANGIKGFRRKDPQEETKSTEMQQEGSKEVVLPQESSVYGTIKYRPSDPVKKMPSRIREVNARIRGAYHKPKASKYFHKNNDNYKDNDRFDGVVREFQPDKPTTNSPLYDLNSRNKGISPRPRPPKDTTYGYGKPIYYQKPKDKSPLQILLDSMTEKSSANADKSSRINYRDESSRGINYREQSLPQPAALSTAFGPDEWSRKKALRKKTKSRKRRKNIMENIQRRLLNDFRTEEAREDKKNRRRSREKSRRRSRNSNAKKHLFSKVK